MTPRNMHGTAVVLGDRGVLITGGSGSGKTALALALVAQARREGMFARLVSDDQVFLSSHGGRLVCSAPSTISGMVEVRGLGPRPIAAEPAAIVDLLVRLAPAKTAERFPEDATETLAGCEVACLGLTERNVVGAAAAVAARLSLPPFTGTPSPLWQKNASIWPARPQFGTCQRPPRRQDSAPAVPENGMERRAFKMSS